MAGTWEAAASSGTLASEEQLASVRTEASEACIGAWVAACIEAWLVVEDGRQAFEVWVLAGKAV